MSHNAPKLEVAKASLLNNALQLEQVFLSRLEAQQLAGTAATQLGFTVNFEPIAWTDIPEKVVAVFPLAVIIEDHTGGSKVELAALRVAMRAFYRTQKPLDGERTGLLPHYLGIVGWMHVWPYARAEVQALSVKMGLPPLVLPVLLAGQTAEVEVHRIEIPSVEPQRARPRRAKKSKSR